MSRYATYQYEEVTKNGEVVKVTKCVSHYAGKVVKGVAKCHPSDNYNQEIGNKIARARCDIKVGERRVANAEQRFKDAGELLAYATKYYNDMKEYVETSKESLKEARKALEGLPTNR